jgi:hypothetical protein
VILSWCCVMVSQCCVILRTKRTYHAIHGHTARKAGAITPRKELEALRVPTGLAELRGESKRLGDSKSNRRTIMVRKAVPEERWREASCPPAPATLS